MSALPGRIASCASAIVLALCGCPLPASAAATEPTITTHFQQLTLAPGAKGSEAMLLASLEGGEEAALLRVRYTVDYSGIAAFADLEVTETSGYLSDNIGTLGPRSGLASSAPADEGCQKSGTEITCSLPIYNRSPIPLLALAFFGVELKAGATTGASGTVRVTASVGAGPESTSESLVRVGEGVNLAAAETDPVEAAPGETTEVAARIRNVGTTVADGVVLYVGASRDVLADTSYRNCGYSLVMICTFDTKLKPGTTYATSEPLGVRPPVDSIDGSRLEGELNWATATEWEDTVKSFPMDTLFGESEPGTGDELTLIEVTGTAGVPQVDTDYTNNTADLTMVVEGGDSPDLAAIGAEVDATVGDNVAVRAGRVNHGPGRLYPELFANNILPVEVKVPAGTSAVGGDCWPKEEAVLTCFSEAALGPGEREYFEIELWVEEKPGKAGWIRTSELSEDADQANNTAELVVTVAGSEDDDGLPITGPGGLAAGGVMLVGLGFLGRFLARRRPHGAHRPQHASR